MKRVGSVVDVLAISAKNYPNSIVCRQDIVDLFNKADNRDSVTAETVQNGVDSMLHDLQLSKINIVFDQLVKSKMINIDTEAFKDTDFIQFIQSDILVDISSMYQSYELAKKGKTKEGMDKLNIKQIMKPLTMKKLYEKALSYIQQQ